MNRVYVFLLTAALIGFNLGCRTSNATQTAAAQSPASRPASQPHEKSVRPGINKSYENPDIDKWKNVFEDESRDAYQNRHKIVDAVNARPPAVLADVGAGTGLFTILFAKKLQPTGSVIAVEITPNFLQHIQKRAADNNLTNVRTVLCKTDSVELPPNSVDIAFLCNTYHHLEYPISTMTSIYRALKPGGQLIVIDFKRIPGKSKQWILNHVRAGQELVNTEIQSVGFKLDKNAPPAPYLTENYLLQFKKPR